MDPLRTKAAFYAAWNAGRLGNRPRTWHSVEALRTSGFTGEVTIRHARLAGWKSRYRVPVAEALTSAPDGATFNESAPDECLVLQGEVGRTERGLELVFSTTPGLKMKEAMNEAQYARCLRASAILDHHLWPASRDDLDALLDLYPDHVIEFSAYDRAVGDQPHRNTLIWEVRLY